jgi:cation transport ATPase
MSLAQRADAQLESMMRRSTLVFLPLAAAVVAVSLFVVEARWYAWLPIVVGMLLVGCLYELGYSRGQKAALRLVQEERCQSASRDHFARIS